jgi:hypothetical protein
MGRGQKASMVGAETEEEKQMRMVLHSELVALNENELSALFAEVSRKLARTEKGSAARRNALATLENINVAQAAKLAVTRACG